MREHQTQEIETSADPGIMEFAGIRLLPAYRQLERNGNSVSVEPLVMRVLLTLGSRAGQVVTRRDLFDACWGATTVGDDSLNRIIAAARKALNRLGGNPVQIETIPAVGYALRFTQFQTSGTLPVAEVGSALDAGRASWRQGLPAPDHLAMERLRHATRSHSDNAEVWGMLALLCRYSAEYASPKDSADFVSECESAAQHALALEPTQPAALTALATVAPWFGRWLPTRVALSAVLQIHPDTAAAIHELAIIEMSTGRVVEAKRLLDKLIDADPLAPCYNYKSIWQHWSTGDLAGMDHVADRAIQLWPRHPAVWMARFWTLAHTDRGSAALAMLQDADARPTIPKPMLELLSMIASAAATKNPAKVDQAVRACTAAAARGPAHAVAALLGLGIFNATQESFEVAYGYYARVGVAPVPVRHTDAEPSINDQHRRVTQPLFTPAAASMREDRRFNDLCERIGLTAYWQTSGLQPDFVAI